jgi:hypothetical protein
MSSWPSGGQRSQASGVAVGCGALGASSARAGTGAGAAGRVPDSPSRVEEHSRRACRVATVADYAGLIDPGLAVLQMQSNQACVEDGLRVEVERAVEVRDRAGLAEAIHSDRHNGLAEHRSHPRE